MNQSDIDHGKGQRFIVDMLRPIICADCMAKLERRFEETTNKRAPWATESPADSPASPVQQLKAEIAEVVRYLEDNHPSSEFGPNHIISHVLRTLRQLSAV